MISSVQRWLTAVVAIALLVGCASSPFPQVTAADMAWVQKQQPDATVDDLKQGRTLYMSRCSSCHRLVEPSSIRPDKWRHEVETMRDRAKLAQQDVDLIVLYLVTIASRT